MKTITVTRADYNDLVYPVVAVCTHDDVASLRIADKILTKLEEAGKPDPVPARKEVCKACGAPPLQAAPPLYKMEGISAEFELEDAEATFLHEKLTELTKTITGNRMRTVLPVIAALEASA